MDQLGTNLQLYTNFIDNILNLLILICVLLYLYKVVIKKLNIEGFSQHDEMDTAFLLTTAVNPNKKFSSDEEKNNEVNKRIIMYEKVINKYLKNTNIKLFIIESTDNNKLGQIFNNNPRIKFFSFKKKDSVFFHNIDNDSTSAYEAYSIINAYKKFDLHKYNKIIKVTGRYYIPNIEKIIRDLQQDPDIYVQNKVFHDSKSQRSEIFGMKSNLCLGIMIGVIKNKILIEEYLYNLYYKHDKNKNPGFIAQRLPLIKLDEVVYRGGDGQAIDEL